MGSVCGAPRSYRWASERNSSVTRYISPSHQLPGGHLGPSPWKRSWVMCQDVTPYLPSSCARPRGLSASPGSSGGAGLLGPPAAAAAAKALRPLLPGPLEIREAAATEQPRPWWELPAVGREPGNKGQELACLRGRLECALRSGLPGAQVSMSPEPPLPLRGLPAHCTAPELGRSADGSAWDAGERPAQPLFPLLELSQDPSRHFCQTRWLLCVGRYSWTCRALALTSEIKGEGSASRIDGNLGLVSSLFGSDMACNPCQPPPGSVLSGPQAGLAGCTGLARGSL